MHSLGHPKRVLVGLRFEGDELPVAGAPVFADTDDDTAAMAGKAVGGVTSSTVSPLLSQAGVGFAVIKWGRHRPGTALRVDAGGTPVRATVQEKLRFTA